MEQEGRVNKASQVQGDRMGHLDNPVTQVHQERGVPEEHRVNQAPQAKMGQEGLLGHPVLMGSQGTLEVQVR